MRKLALVLAVVAALAVPATAGSKIRPQLGIAGVHLDMKRQRVLDKLGAPSEEVHSRNDFGRYTKLIYRRNHLSVYFQGDRAVTAISTTGRTQRTSSGVGVGSREAVVRRRVRGVRCQTFGRFRSCHVGRYRAGARVTEFAIARGRVSRVTIGFVID